MRVLYNNHVFDETVTASTENANFPLTNITESKVLSDVFKMTATSGTVTISGTDLAANCAAVIGHNAGTVTINGESITVTGETVDVLYFDTETADEWVFSFSGSANIEVAGLWIGEYWQLPIVNPGQTLSLRDDSTVVTTNGGQIYVYDRPGLKLIEYQVQLPFITTAERDEVIDYFETAGKQQAIVDVWEDSHTVQAPFYGYQTVNPITCSRTGDQFRPWSSALIFRETK